MSFNATLLAPPIKPFHINYVDEPRNASSVRRHRAAMAARRVAIAFVAAATIAAAAIGFAQAANAPVRTDPVRGEFRLAPGNQEPPGYVIKLDAGQGLSGLQANKVIPSLVPALPGRVPAA
jgi:hypothetical protein